MKFSSRAERIDPFYVMEVAKAAQAMARELAGTSEPMIFLNIGEPDFTAPEGVQAAAEAAIRGGLTQYTQATGLPALRQALSDKIARLYGHRYDPDTEITVTAGATQALFTAIAALVHPGDEVIVFTPVYDSYAPSVELQGGKVVEHVELAARRAVDVVVIHGWNQLLGNLQPLPPRRQCHCIVVARSDRPEPQTGPRIHQRAQPTEGRVGRIQPLFGLGSGVPGGAGTGVGSPHVDRAAQAMLQVGQSRRCLRPELLDTSRQRCEAVEVGLARRLQNAGLPLFQRLGSARGEFLRLLAVADGSPTVARHQEVVDRSGWECVSQWHVDRWQDVGRFGLAPWSVRQLLSSPDGPSTPDQAVARSELHPEPRRLETGIHGVEPQAHLGQFDGGGVEVDAVALVEREMGLHLLQLTQVGVGIKRLADLDLTHLQVQRCDLVDRLVEERPGTEGGLADGEVEHPQRFVAAGTGDNTGRAALGRVVVEAQ